MNDSITPTNQQDFDNYYQFRWKMLRQPWQQPLGSEQDELEQQAVHRMVLNEKQQVIAVGRLHKVSQTQAKIRYMAVDSNCQGQGLGRQIVDALEYEASKQGVSEITLNAREDAEDFYQKLGYQSQGFSHLLYDEIRHVLMIKKLNCLKEHRLSLSQKLQNTWHETIPLSKAMKLNICHYDQQTLVTNCDPDFNKNLHNTMFAGSIYTHATLTGWGWVYLQLEHESLDGDIVLADANIRYLKPIKGPAYAMTSTEQVKGKLAVLVKGKKARFSITVNVMSGDKVAAIFTGVYVVLPKNDNRK